MTTPLEGSLDLKESPRSKTPPLEGSLDFLRGPRSKRRVPRHEEGSVAQSDLSITGGSVVQFFYARLHFLYSIDFKIQGWVVNLALVASPPSPSLNCDSLRRSLHTLKVAVGQLTVSSRKFVSHFFLSCIVCDHAQPCLYIVAPLSTRPQLARLFLATPCCDCALRISSMHLGCWDSAARRIGKGHASDPKLAAASDACGYSCPQQSGAGDPDDYACNHCHRRNGHQ